MSAQPFFCSCGGREGNDFGSWYTRLVLYFNNTPNEFFAAIRTIQAAQPHKPFIFYWAYRKEAVPGEPPLFVSIKLARRVTRNEYQILGPLVAQVFEPYLKPVWRLPADVVEGGYEPPGDDFALHINPDFYLSLSV